MSLSSWIPTSLQPSDPSGQHAGAKRTKFTDVDACLAVFDPRILEFHKLRVSLHIIKIHQAV